MKYNNRVISIFLSAILVFASLACQTQQAEPGKTSAGATVKAQSPTEAYKLLYAACKAKNTEQIKQLMSKSSLGLADFSANQQKKTVDKILENGLLAPTLADSITEIRDERIKGNFGRIEVRNERENRWEDLAFVLEDGGWKVAVGDLFQGTFDPDDALPMKSSNVPLTNAPQTMKNSMPSDGIKSVEVPKEAQPKK